MPATPARKALAQPAARPPAQDGELCLLGATHMQGFIDFVRQRARDGHRMDRGHLAQLWRKAAGVYRELEVSEAGAGDVGPILPLPPAAQARVDRLKTLPHFRNTFSAVPVSFGMVELDRLVVCQRHLTLASVHGLMAGWKRKPSGQALAAICLPDKAPPMEFDVVQREGDEFVFRSNNHDARFLGARVLAGADLPDLALPGHPQALLCLAVGFTSNVLNAVRYGNRLVLNNGYHRAYALRAMGVTHVPCVIHVCGHWEDVGLAAGGEMYENGTPYFSAARPPLLRDFFDSRLTHRIATLPAERHVRITYEAKKTLWSKAPRR